jgi:glucose/arabinose dehydrogenase
MGEDMRGISIRPVLVTGTSAILCLAVALAISTPELSAVRKEDQEQPVASGTGMDKFVPVDTSRLMGSPDGQPTLGVERAFPQAQFTRPVEFTHAGDGSDRVFVVEQDGRIRVFPNRADAKETKVFLDLRDVVRREHNEEGLLGLAFHPNYRTNGQFFVFYSVTPRGSVVSRFRVSKDDPNRADRDSEEKLLQFPKPYGNHNGGCLRFGPDGYLYISVGDGGLAGDPHGNGQNLETLNAKILRIDVDHKDAKKNYAIPRDNPFVSRGGNVRGEIWAYGLRNVWRYSFDRPTATLWAADVGQDRHEEVDIIVRGGNYGWNIREGKHPLNPDADRSAVGEFIEPVLDYPRVEGKSITGGMVYRGKRLPDLAGAYLYADFISGNVWALRWDGKKVTANPKIARTSLLISAFGEDEAGEVYFTAFDGYVYRFRAAKEKVNSTLPFPRTLTETGLFASVKDHTPAAGLIPYTVNVPLWSDGAVKDRYIVLPDKGKVVFKEQHQWEFPVGTVLVKTFLLNTDLENPVEMRRL